MMQPTIQPRPSTTLDMVYDAVEVETLGPLQRQQHAEKERLYRNLAFIEVFWRRNPIALGIFSVLNASGLGTKRRRVKVLEATLPTLDKNLKAAEDRLDSTMEHLKTAGDPDLIALRDYYLTVYRIAHEVPSLVDALTTSVSLLNDLRRLPPPEHCTPDHITSVSFSVDLAHTHLTSLQRMLDLMATYMHKASSHSLKTIWHRLYSVVAHLLAETKLCLNVMHTVYAPQRDMATIDEGDMDASNDTACHIIHLTHLLHQVTPALDAHASQAEQIMRDTTALLQHFHRLVAAYAEKHEEDPEIS